MSTTETALDALLGDEAKAALLALRGQAGYDLLLQALGGIPDEDDTTEISNGALLVALGDATLDELGAQAAEARRAAVDAMDRLRGAILWERASGTRDADLTRRSGVSRPTVLSWTGR